MDLLTLILLRLPIGRLIDLNQIADKDFVQQRLRAVNQLDMKMPLEAYVTFCGIQGELCEQIPRSSDRVAGFLLGRAAFLKDTQLYLSFCKCADTIDLNAALQSDVPEIQNIALEKSHLRAPIDYSAINWTPDLKERFLRRNADDHFMHGYLIYPGKLVVEEHATRGEILSTLDGYVTAAVSESEDQTTVIPAVESAVADIRDIPSQTIEYHLRNCGYYADLDGALPIALRQIHSGMILKILGSGDKRMIERCKKFSASEISITLKVNKSLLDHSRRLLTADRTGEIFSKSYRTFLQISLGLPVQRAEFTRDEEEVLNSLMLLVAHPQLSQTAYHLGKMESMIQYDPVNYFRCIPVDESPSVDQRNLYALIARGQLSLVYNTPMFITIWRRLMNSEY